MEKIVSISVAPKQVRDFKDLEVWQTARQLRREMYGVANGLPDVEKFGLASQIRRAAVWLPGKRLNVPPGAWLFVRVEGPSHDLRR